MADKKPPAGWTQSTDTNKPTIYEANIGYISGNSGAKYAVVAETDYSNASITYYRVEGIGFTGRRIPFLTTSSSGKSTENDSSVVRDIFKSGNLYTLERSVEKRAFEINQTFGNERERESVANSYRYKSLSQTQGGNPDKSPGPSADKTGGSGGGTEEPAGENLPFGFGTSSERFNDEKAEKFANGLLVYPIDMNSSQDRIVIVQKFYKSIIGAEEQIPEINYNSFSQDRFTKSIQGIIGTAVLPMPNDISETNVTLWGEDSLSTLAGMLGQSALKGASAVAQGDVINFAKTLAETVSGVTDPKAKEAIKQFLTLNAASALVKKTGVNFDPEAFRARITGTAINQNMELLFQGPKLRSFGFQFKLTPRSDLEARNIRYLIKFFKKGMAPKRKQSEPFFLGAPNIFDIHFRSGNNVSSDFNKDLKSIGNIKTCALQQCVVNYTPDGFYAAFEDPQVKSQPISVIIQLSFTELTPLYNDNYNSNEDNAGWDINSLNDEYYTNIQ